MRVLFLQDNGLNESLALTELSAYLKRAGHTTELFIEREEKNLFGKITGFNPDLFILPCSVLGHLWVLRIASELKKRFPKKKIVLGGTHPSFYPEIIEDENVDIICIGEADDAILELCDTIQRGGDISHIQNLYVKTADGEIIRNPVRPLIADLDSLPMPDRELYYKYPFIRDFTWKKFMSGRGCVNNCAYCYNPAIREKYTSKGSYVRMKSPEKVVNEIQHIKDHYPFRSAHFSDDIFASNPAWLETFTEEYRQRVGVPFSCNMCVEFATERTVGALKRAGCRAIAIGVETGDETMRQQIMGKTCTDDEIRRAAKVIKGHRIVLVTFNILASPGETPEQALKTLEFNSKIDADYSIVNFGVPIPNTRYAQMGIEMGVLKQQSIDELLSGFDFHRVGPHPIFKTPYEREFINLNYLFRLGNSIPLSLPLIRSLIHLPPNPLFKVLNLMMLYSFKQIYGIPWIDGMRYFLHVGYPDRRTTNFPSLI
ncbi:MAG: radical SAM protein [bacterium]